MRRTAAWLALALTLGWTIAVPAQAAGRAGSAAPHRAERATARVRIVDFRFRPAAIEVARGTRVRWTNRGGVSHTSTSADGVWDSGTLAPGDPFSRVFRRTGTFAYGCSIHIDMTGTVVVT
jgi:plastocyanin